MLSKREKIAYGLGDTASNIVFQTVMMFLTYFYTDIFGLAPAYIGFMFLAVRIIEGTVMMFGIVATLMLTAVIMWMRSSSASVSRSHRFLERSANTCGADWLKCANRCASCANDCRRSCWRAPVEKWACNRGHSGVWSQRRVMDSGESNGQHGRNGNLITQTSSIFIARKMSDYVLEPCSYRLSAQADVTRLQFPASNVHNNTPIRRPHEF